MESMQAGFFFFFFLNDLSEQVLQADNRFQSQIATMKVKVI